MLSDSDKLDAAFFRLPEILASKLQALGRLRGLGPRLEGFVDRRVQVSAVEPSAGRLAEQLADLRRKGRTGVCLERLRRKR